MVYDNSREMIVVNLRYSVDARDPEYWIIPGIIEFYRASSILRFQAMPTWKYYSSLTVAHIIWTRDESNKIQIWSKWKHKCKIPIKQYIT